MIVFFQEGIHRLYEFFRGACDPGKVEGFWVLACRRPGRVDGLLRRPLAPWPVSFWKDRPSSPQLLEASREHALHVSVWKEFSSQVPELIVTPPLPSFMGRKPSCQARPFPSRTKKQHRRGEYRCLTCLLNV